MGEWDDKGRGKRGSGEMRKCRGGMGQLFQLIRLPNPARREFATLIFAGYPRSKVRLRGLLTRTESPKGDFAFDVEREFISRVISTNELVGTNDILVRPTSSGMAMRKCIG